MMADIEFKESISKNGEDAVLGRYLPAHKKKKLFDGRGVILTSVDKISVLLEQYDLNYSVEKIKKLYDLRNKIVHSSIGPEELKYLTGEYDTVQKMSRILCAHLISERKILQKIEEILASCSVA